MRLETRHEHNAVEASSEETAAIASNLAPLEEQESSSKQRVNGALRLDTSELKLPKGLIEDNKQGNGLGFEPVVIFLLLLVLAFIAFIAYLISIEPSK